MSDVDLQKLLETQGYRFDFYQAVRLLEASDAESPGVGGLGPFTREILRILPSTSLSFAPSDIQRIVRRPYGGEYPRWALYEHFLGLYGPNTASPIFIAEMIAQCIEDEDPLRDFLDIFNHRVLSLYYRAWKKHNLATSVAADRTDTISRILSSLLGMMDENPVGGSLGFDSKKFLCYHPLFSCSSRSACGLEAILSDYFELESVRVIQFVSRSIKLTSTSHNLISQSGMGGRIGMSFLLGDTIEDLTGQFKICLGSLSKERFYAFQPGGDDYRELVHLVGLYTHKRLGFTLELSLAPGQVARMRVSDREPIGRLGRSIWLGAPGEDQTTVTIPAEYAG